MVESLFSGMLTENYGDRAFGIPVEKQAACDRKPAAIRFLTRNARPKHLYTDAADLANLKEDSQCMLCGAGCAGPQKRVDLVRFGLPS